MTFVHLRLDLGHHVDVCVDLGPFRTKQAPYRCATNSMVWWKKLPALSSSSCEEHFPISVTNTAPQLDFLH